ATALPGWTRFPAAEEWLALHHRSAARSAGDSPATAINDPAQREGLFREFQASLAIAPGRAAPFRAFLAWQAAQSGTMRVAAAEAAQREAVFREFEAWRQRPAFAEIDSARAWLGLQ